MTLDRDQLPDPVAECLAGPQPRAGSFIVTIYGDVVEPRGGTLWMGTLIEVCADHGISEGLVRTAVSRLVASGRLAGDRQGRRSYYRLTPEARAEFATAARVLFSPPPIGDGWLIRFGEGELPPGWAAAPGYAVAPDRSDQPRPEGLVLSAEAVSGRELLGVFAASHWDLAPLALAYGGFRHAFEPVADIIAGGYRPDGPVSLALRLRAVHDYRRILLADPRLPQAALPANWPGAEARRLFVSLYQSLAESADQHVGETFRDAYGLLAIETAATAARRERLRNEFPA